MATTTAIAIYFLVWWVTLFAILPWGVKPLGEQGEPGTDPGAPQLPRIAAKLLWTTLVSGAIFALMAAIYVNRWITLDDLAAWMGLPI